ncbi:MAG: argininosuccinate lyase [Thermaerobacter sp.]|nr:argininosuccinate lyase [Thermaerobacter sp.]
MPDLWAGRLPEGSHPDARAFTGTVSWDWRLAHVDLVGSLAHVDMLGAVGLLTPLDRDQLTAGLRELLAEVDAGCPPWDEAAEDVHTAVEQELSQRLGPVAGRLHTARSRNDQVALDLHLYVVDAARELAAALARLILRLADVAEIHAALPMPGYTHLQRAQPITVGHHLLAYGFMWQRDRERLGDVARRAQVSPLGAGALAGSTLKVDPLTVAQQLGWPAVYLNSLDAVSDRDFVAEFVFAAALTLSHLSRWGEELVIWSSAEFGFVELADAWATGSSMMPHKKNPDVAELLRGRSARGVAHLTGLLTLLKGLPLAYNRDLQEDKGYLFGTHDTASGAIDAATGLVGALTFRPERTGAALTTDLLATDQADRLVEEGMPFRQAHGQVASSRDWRQSPAAPGAAVAQSLTERDRVMGPGPLSIARQLAALRRAVAEPV